MSAWMLLIGNVDQRLLRAVVERRTRPLDALMRTLTHLADPDVAITLTLALALGAVPSLREAGMIAAATLATSHLLVQILKRMVSRPRPSFPVGMSALIEAPERFSFPSGHAAAGLSMALPFAVVLPGPLAALVLAVGLAVGVSRCYLGVHYPGDVLMGWALSVGSMLWLSEPVLTLLRG